MVLLRHLLGDVLRRLRLRQGRTLREVSAAARVSLGYLSEVERGQKEASSELLTAICAALDTPLSQVFREVSDSFALAELQSEPVLTGVREPALAGTREPALAGVAERELGRVERAFSPEERARLGAAGSRSIAMPDETVLGTVALRPAQQTGFDGITRRIHDVTDMVPV